MSKQVSLGAFNVTRNGSPIAWDPLSSPPRPDASFDNDVMEEEEEDEDVKLPKDEIHVNRLGDAVLKQGCRILVTCSIETLIGHSYWDTVLYDPSRCKSELRPIMKELVQAAQGEIEEDTTRYLVRGPDAVGDPMKVDARIRKHRRKSLGLVMMLFNSVVVWGVEHDSGHSGDYD